MTASQILEQVKVYLARRSLDSDDYFDFEFHCKVLSCNTRASVRLDQPLVKGLSERQLRILVDATEMEAGVDSFKEAIYEHWLNNNDYWEFEIDIRSPSQAFEMSRLLRLAVRDKNSGWGESECQYRFYVPWDPEHGAGVVVSGGIVTGFGDL